MANELPKISIITPSYNQGKFIRQTIESIQAQNYPNYEHIIVDACSTDDTVEILKSYGSAIHWISEKDKGQADAINKGLRLATGQILAYINSDDYYLPGAFFRVAQEFTATGCQWLTGDYQIVDEWGGPIQSYIVAYKTFFRRFSSRTILLILNYIVQPGTFWRRELTEEIGPFDANLRYALDYDYWMRACQRSMPAVLKEPLVVFRIHSTSKGKVQYQDQFDEELRVLKKYYSNPFICAAHALHNDLIKLSYRILK